MLVGTVFEVGNVTAEEVLDVPCELAVGSIVGITTLLVVI